MRSRDGNHSLPLTICKLIILFNSLALNAGEYFISYKYLVKDASLYNENLQISKAMQKCHGKQSNFIILQNNDNDDLKKIISSNSEEFIDYIHKLGLEVKHQDEAKNGIYSSTTTLTLKTTCFKVDFNENFAKITALK